MAASVPEMDRLATNTVLLVPIVFVAKLAVADAVESVTVSPLTTPDSAADPLFNNAVADVVASYSRLLAVIPVTVSSFAVIDAVVVGWVSV